MVEGFHHVTGSFKSPLTISDVGSDSCELSETCIGVEDKFKL